MNNFLYKKGTQRLLQLFSAIAIVILLISNIYKTSEFIRYGEQIQIIFIVLNLLVSIIFTLIIIFPEKYYFIALICLFYSISIYFLDQESPMSILMFDLALVIFTIRGFFKKHPIIKSVFFFFLFFTFPCLKLLSDKNSFMETFLNNLGFSFVFFLGIFFTYGYASRNAPEEKILNIAKYEGLKESDTEMLRRVLDNQQYKVIAIDLQKSEGTIRNRLNKVYDILGVADRVGFITTYSDFKLIYELETEIQPAATDHHLT